MEEAKAKFKFRNKLRQRTVEGKALQLERRPVLGMTGRLFGYQVRKPVVLPSPPGPPGEPQEGLFAPHCARLKAQTVRMAKPSRDSAFI